MINKTLNSFKFATNGIKTVWREESNFKIQAVVALLVIIFIFYFHFSLVEKSLIILAIMLVLASEMVNTAIEDLCNKVESSIDPVIGKIKDIASGFVLLSSIGALTVGVLVFVSHFAQVP